MLPNAKNMYLSLMYLQVGGVGQAAQAQVQEVLAGESGQPLGGTAKFQQVEEVGRVAGMKDPATRGATTTVTPGAITLTKMTGNLCLGIIEIRIEAEKCFCSKCN